MRFNISSKAFYNAVSAVNKVISNKNSLNILDNFRITLDGTCLTITGADMDNELTARVAVEEAEGNLCFCISARRLVELLKEIPDQGISFSINEETLEVEITYSGGKYELTALGGAEFPEFKEDDETAETSTFNIAGFQLARGLKYTEFAVSDDDYRPMMKGVCLQTSDDKVTFAATDTHKLVRFIDKGVTPGFEGTYIIPLKPVKVLHSVFDHSDSVTLTLTRKSLTAQSDAFTFRCSLLNGRFPDYNRVIPQSMPYQLQIDRVTALNAIRRVAVFVDPGYGLEKFKITPDRLYIKSDDTNLMTCARENIPCTFNGPEMIIGFSAPFLLEFMALMPTDEVYIELSDPSRAGIFRPSENAENTDLVMVLMPMNVNGF